MRLRTVVIGVVVLFVALIATGVAILMSIDFNQYKGQIADAVKAATGRELTINGNFKLGLSLTPSVAVDDVSFANAPGGSRPNMLTLKHLAVQMELIPLLSRQIKVDSLVLNGADILLETDSKGQGNWVFGTQGAAGATATATAPATPAGTMPLPQVSTIQIRDSLVTYRDGVTGASHSFKVDKLDATTGNGVINIAMSAVLGKTPLSVTGNVGAPELLSGSVPYPLDLSVTSGNTTASVKGEVAQITKMQGINLQMSAKGNSLSDLNGLAGISLPPLGPYSFAGVATDVTGGYKVTAMQLTMGGSSLTGDVSVALGGKRPKVAANLAATKIDLKDFGVKPSPAGGGSGGSSGGSSDGRVFPNTPLPFAGLMAADADLNLAAQQMIKAPVTMENVKLVLSLANGRLQVKPFSAGIAGGTSGHEPDGRRRQNACADFPRPGRESGRGGQSDGGDGRQQRALGREGQHEDRRHRRWQFRARDHGGPERQVRRHHGIREYQQRFRQAHVRGSVQDVFFRRRQFEPEMRRREL